MTSPPEPRKPGELYRGAALAVVLTWSLRAIGLVSVFILARVLTPHDFGIVGLAMTAVAMVEVFSYLGLWQTLLRMHSPDRSFYDTAWTINFLVFNALALVLLVIAGPAARFYNEPDVQPVIMVLSLRFVMLGLTNIGIVEFDRDLNFGRDLKMRATARLLAFAVTVGLAVWLRSYWALIAGMIVQSLAQSTASYVMHPYRPRFSLSRHVDLLGTSLWIFGGVAAQVLYSQVERVMVGRIANAASVGAFGVCKDISSIFTQEIATALNRVTFVETSRSGAFAEQGGRVATMLGGYAMMAAPMGLGLAAVSDSFIAVLLGNQWTDSSALMAPIAIASALMAVFKLIASSLQAGGHEKASAILSFVGVIVLVAGTFAVVALGGGVLAIAEAGLAVTIALLVAAVIALARFAPYAKARYVVAIARPFLAATIMFASVVTLPDLSSVQLVNLTAHAAFGAIAYFIALFALWKISGSPMSAEGELFRVAGRLLPRRA